MDLRIPLVFQGRSPNRATCRSQSRKAADSFGQIHGLGESQLLAKDLFGFLLESQKVMNLLGAARRYHGFIPPKDVLIEEIEQVKIPVGDGVHIRNLRYDDVDGRDQHQQPSAFIIQAKQKGRYVIWDDQEKAWKDDQQPGSGAVFPTAEEDQNPGCRRILI